MTLAETMRKLGGKRISRGAADHWDFGWERTSDEDMARMYANGVVRDFKANEDLPEITGDTVNLYPEVKTTFGAYYWNWQMIGSCVHGGGQNGMIVLIAQETTWGAKHEAAEIPWCWLAYAHARSTAMGNPNRSEGDGASATAFGEQLRDRGVPSSLTPGLDLAKPQMIPIEGRPDAFAMVYTTASLQDIARFNPERMSPREVCELELRFSTAKNLKPEWNEAAKKHKIQLVRCRSAAEVQRELRRRRPILSAGDWGGLMKCPTEGGLLLNRHASSWGHQQSINAYRKHPTLGDVYRWQNQWYGMNQNLQAYSVHGICEPNEAPGGYWTKAVDVDYQCRTGEVFSVAGFEGYEDGKVDWSQGA